MNATGSSSDPGYTRMEYGSGRLIDGRRHGLNVRLSFDGFKVRPVSVLGRLTAFAVRPDQDKPGLFDNVPNHASDLGRILASDL